MCGRARCTLRADDFSRACHLNARPLRHLHMDRFRPSYNVAPGFNLPVLRRDDAGDGNNGVVLHCMKWGLIPSFTNKSEKPNHFRMFNARCESIKEKPSFRRLIPKNRCVVCFEGFYEWKKDGSQKQPYYVHFKDDRPLVLAALFDSWKNSEGEVVYTFTIVTTSSSDSALEWLHDRMPVVLGDKEKIDSWLSDDGDGIDKILKPYQGKDLGWYPVTQAMGKVSFDGVECIKEVQVKKSCETKSISQFFTKKQALVPLESKEEEDVEVDESVDVKEEKDEHTGCSEQIDVKCEDGGERFITGKHEGDYVKDLKTEKRGFGGLSDHEDKPLATEGRN